MRADSSRFPSIGPCALLAALAAATACGAEPAPTSDAPQLPCPPGVCPWHDRTPATCVCDGHGRLLSVDFDLEGDCHADYTTHYWYAGAGGPVREEVDLWRDGVVDAVTTWYRAGSTVVELADEDADGDVDRRQVRLDDAHGRTLVTLDERTGETARITSNAYSDAGQLLGTVVGDARGDVAYTVAHAYDARGNPRRVTFRTGPPDELVFTEQSWRYGADRVVESWVDYERDGSRREATRSTRDAGGRLLVHAIDGDGDSRYEQVARFLYDDAGRAVEAHVEDHGRTCIVACSPYGDPAFQGPLSPGYCPLFCP